jgi:hypothetical protein
MRRTRGYALAVGAMTAVIEEPLGSGLGWISRRPS